MSTGNTAAKVYDYNYNDYKVLNVVRDQIKSHMLALGQTRTVSLPVISKKAVCGRQKQMTKKKQK